MKLKMRLFDADNIVCARIVLAEPERYPEMQEWARAVLEKTDEQNETNDHHTI